MTKRRRNDSYDVIPVSFTHHPRRNGDPVNLSSPRRRGSSKYNPYGFPPARE
ncbi:MAG: hypothetical protein SFT93_02110 [Rickettsiaceae bacterium]|nr:hypothetical protein [Rickettsiaceae bacterium]